MKIVINQCHGGFGLSTEAIERYAELKGLKLYKVDNNPHSDPVFLKVPKEQYDKLSDKEKAKNYFRGRAIDRNDKILIQVVEELGKKSSGFCASLKITEIPDDVDWVIDEYDGSEWVAEKHRTWS